MLPCWGICAGFLLLPLTASLHFFVSYSQLWVWLFVPFSCSCPLIPVPCLLSVLPYAPPLASQKVFSDTLPFPSAGVGGLYSNKGRMGIDGIERQLQGLRLRHCCHGFDVKEKTPGQADGMDSNPWRCTSTTDTIQLGQFPSEAVIPVGVKLNTTFWRVETLCIEHAKKTPYCWVIPASDCLAFTGRWNRYRRRTRHRYVAPVANGRQGGAVG